MFHQIFITPPYMNILCNIYMIFCYLQPGAEAHEDIWGQVTPLKLEEFFFKCIF